MSLPEIKTNERILHLPPQLTLSIQLSKSASLKSGGGLVTPESRVNAVGVNCN